MTDLEMARKISNEIVEMKKEAVRKGEDSVTYELFGKKRTEYYHSGRWNDRPSTMGKTKSRR